MAVVGVGVAPVGVGCRGATPPKELDSDVPSGGGQAARRGIGIGTECRRGVPEFRAGPGVSPGGSGGTPGNRHRDGMQTGCPGIPRRPGSAARADGIRFGRKGTAEPSGRGASSRRRFCRRSSSTRRCWSRFQGRRASVSASKIRPGPGSAVEDDVEPDTIRTGSVTAPRFRSRRTSFAFLHSAGSPPLPDSANRPRRCTLLGEASRFASTDPENLRPPTRHRDLHRPTHTDINKTAKHIREA